MQALLIDARDDQMAFRKIRIGIKKFREIERRVVVDHVMNVGIERERAVRIILHKKNPLLFSCFNACACGMGTYKQNRLKIRAHLTSLKYNTLTANRGCGS